MKKTIYVIALVLIIIGGILLSYSYTGFSYHVRDEIIELGPLSLGTDADVHMPFSPIAGWICLALGFGLAVFNWLKR